MKSNHYTFNKKNLFLLFFILSLSFLPTHPLKAQVLTEEATLNQLSSVLSALQSFINSLTTKSVAQTADITTGLVGHWKFDEGSGTTAGDSSGNNNTGTLTNGPSWTTGKIGAGALSFDGVDDYVNVANESNFDFERTSPFSVSGWALSTGTSNGFIFSKARNGGNFEGWYISNDGGQHRLVVNFVGATAGHAIIARTPSNSFSLGVWHHVAMTYDGSSTAAGVHVYIDGVDRALTATSDDLASSILTNVTAEIGRNRSSAVEFKGSLDDVRIYNRALTAADVSALYAYTGGSYPTPYTTPAPGDSTPPILSNLTTGGVTSSGATITWNTNEPATSQVEYGLTTAYGNSTTLVSTLSTSHSHSLTNLTANTTYHYRVIATDAAGNTITSGDNSFTTSAPSYPTPYATPYATPSYPTPYPTPYATPYATPTSSGNTINAASCSRADVQTAINAAVDGDTVVIPTGTCTWTSGITLTKAITLRGKDDCTLDGDGRAIDCQTIIIDDVAGEARLIDISLVANEMVRVAHLKIQDGARGAGVGVQGIIRILGTNTTVEHTGRFRLDHLVLFKLQGFAIRPVAAYGVIDHNTITVDGTSQALYTFTPTFYTWADARWAADSNFGGENFVFFENNSVTRDVVSGSAFAIIDGYGGARYVIRHNDFVKGLVECHGTESAGRPRGCRAMEVYGNTFVADGNASAPVGIRSGVALVYDNVMTNFGANPHPASLANLRTIGDFSPWDIADGAHLVDVNNSGNPIETHIATGAGTRTVTVAGAGWTPNALIGYTIRKMSSPCNVPIASVDVDDNEFHTSGPHGLTTGNAVTIKNHLSSTPHIFGTYTATVVDSNTFTLNGQNITVAGTGGFASIGGANQRVCASPVISNTSDTLTFAFSFGGAPGDNMAFTAGDVFHLNLITEVFDAPGRSGGTNLNGIATPVIPNSNDQIDDPIYEWNNLEDGVEVDILIRSEYVLQIRENEHFFNDTQKPSYTPYTYPHPLVSGAAAPPYSYPTPSYPTPAYATPAATTTATTTTVSTKFTVGGRVQTNTNVNVRASASASGNLLGTQSSGLLGTVSSGPIYADSLNWWNINYDTGADGYSAEDFLNVYALSYTTPAAGATYTTPYTPATTPSYSGGGGSTTATPGILPTSLNLTRTLSVGSTGTDVVNLQNYLITSGYLAIGYNTGYYGTITRAAVQKYQCDKAIVCTGDESTTGYGAVGNQTRASLRGGSSSSGTTTPTTLTEEEKQALITQIKAQLVILIQQLILMLSQGAQGANQ